MLLGKIVDNGGRLSVELSNGDSFKVDAHDLQESLRESGTEVNVSLIPVGESTDQAQARELLNYLLQIT